MERRTVQEAVIKLWSRQKSYASKIWRRNYSGFSKGIPLLSGPGGRKGAVCSNTVGADPEYKNKKIGILVEDLSHITMKIIPLYFHGKMTVFTTIRSEIIRAVTA